MKKLIGNLKLFFYSLFHGMKAADDVLTTSNKELSSGGAVEEQKMEEHNLYASLLKGEVTQEVKDLRYEMYESVKQSKDWKVIGYSGQAVKKNHMLDKTPMKIDEEDGLKVILIQDNKVYMQGADSSLNNLGKILETRTEADAEHTFKATHEYFVRHKIEAFSKKVVVKLTGEENKFKLDFYLSEFPVENDPRAVYVVKELESLYKSGSRTSDLTDLITLTFVTDKAYGDDDWKIYDFRIKEYIGVKKFDGNYILSFYASLPDGVKDTTEEFNDEESVKKFKNKEPRKKKTIALTDAIAMTKEKEEKIDEKKANDLIKKVKNKK
jgi:hypothetical protein